MTFPYKHTAYIPRSNDVETFVSTWNKRGVCKVGLGFKSDVPSPSSENGKWKHESS